MTLACQFQDAIADLRTAAEAEEFCRKLWTAWGEGKIAEADAEAISAAMEARRTALLNKADPWARAAALRVQGRQRGS